VQVGKLKTNDFKDLRFKGSTYKTSQFLFVYRVLEDSIENKLFFGSTVTKKIGNAVLRNRSKRIIREVMRNFLSSQTLFVVDKNKSYKLVYLNIVVLKSSQNTIGYLNASKQFSKFFDFLKNSA